MRDVQRCDVQWLEGLPITNPARTLIDLAAVVEEERLEIALDYVLHRGLSSLERLRHRVDALGGRGVTGTRVLRVLLKDRGLGEAVPESVLETRFLQLLRKHHLPLPRRQRTIEAAGGRYRLDFYYPDQDVVVEVDGCRWHSSRAAMQKDRRRDNELNVRKQTVIRLTWFDVTHDEAYVEGVIRSALAGKSVSV